MKNEADHPHVQPAAPFPDDLLEGIGEEHQAVLRYIRYNVISEKMTLRESEDYLIDYWLGLTGEVVEGEVEPSESDLFDPVYAFATWTFHDLTEKRQEYEQLLQGKLHPTWRTELERQQELINLELAYRRAAGESE